MRLRDLWWLFLLRGLLLIIFGVLAIAQPVITFVTLAFVFSFYILLSGVLNIIHSITGRRAQRNWAVSLILGILEIAVGAYALNSPNISVPLFILLIAFTFIIRGIMEIIVAFDRAYSGSSRVLLGIAGLLSVLAGIVILQYPAAGTLAFTWVMGVYAFIAGSFTVALSISIRRITEELAERTEKRSEQAAQREERRFAGT